MRRFVHKRAWLVALGAVLIALGAGAAPAWGAVGDPLFVLVPPDPSPPAIPPPVGYLEGPCGIGVDSSGDFYVSDYYHHTIDLFGPSEVYLSQLAGEDPLDGPCGLALDSSNNLYVNNFDRNVVKFNASPSFGAGTTIAGVGVDATHPSGVTVDPTTDDVYVDDRTYITAYDSSGAQLMDGINPLKIGEGTLGEGYGLAIDATGRLYVADASDNTVKVYDPAISKTNPFETITGPPGGFTSLRHAAIAVDRVSGHLYVVDDLHPQYAEEPAAQVEVFDAAGIYLGVLKYQIVDALPPGLAVDQSNGRVYVTSGNTDQAGVYAYAAGSQVGSSQLPSVGLNVSTSGTGGGAVTSDLGGIDCTTACSAQIRSGAQVALTATPDADSTFTGWSGAGCSGTGECTVAMSEATSVGAEFEALPSSSSSTPAPAQLAGAPPATPPAASPRARHRHRAHRHHHVRHRHHHRVRHRHIRRALR